MGLYRTFSVKDSYITNRMFSTSENQRATGSNFGAAPFVSVFKLTGSTPASTVELARSLVQFDLTELSGKIYTDQLIPSSSVSYYLKMYDAEHGERKPENYNIFAYPLSRSWIEGSGVDNEKYRDFGAVNWLSASATTAWSVTGSDYYDTADFGSGSQFISDRNGNLEMDVTDVVKNWLTGAIPNYGLLLRLGNEESDHTTNSYYLKSFHSRETQFIDKLPYIEARWSNVKKDNRNNFAYNTENKMFMYNIIRGERTATGETVSCRIQDHLIGVSASYTNTFDTYEIESGVLTASINVELTGNVSFSSSWYDIWYSSSRVYMTGTFTPLILTGSTEDLNKVYSVNIDNLRRKYRQNEEARWKVSVVEKNYKTHKIVHSASLDLDRNYIEKMYLKVINEENGEEIIPYGTGSIPFTQLSYDANGNYFDVDMSMFIPGIQYRAIFLIDINKHTKQEIDNDFIFKVI
jgi:hypothetical protein